ncbi:hypothetical protein [uncultured Sulfitobacter sp.]|uniref:hypothetical protein n=1 Tax=uncultured Sulfitobacter sp. TaxID=191468 RepID=UPI00262F3E68|nr:hypothetical protein [uncultured Sulfitobacter sp.]
MSDPWDGILNEDEEILWQGTPAHGFALAQPDIPALIYGLCCLAFSVFWIMMVSDAGRFTWLDLVPLGIGIAFTCYSVLRDTVARRYSFYTLTNQRAIVGTSYPWSFKRLMITKVTSRTPIHLQRGHTVVFGVPKYSSLYPLPLRRPQFTRIDDAENVLSLMQEIQKDTP